MDPQQAVFRTKVDLWLAAVLVGALGLMVWTTATAAREDPVTGLIAAGVTGGVVLLTAALSLPTEYVVTGTALVVRFGLFRHEIPLAAVERVYPTRNPLSAPAWSLDRLGVRYHTGERRGLLLISPSDREAFLAALATRAGLERRGTELLRPAPSVHR
jgi:hypothetical protein